MERGAAIEEMEQQEEEDLTALTVLVDQLLHRVVDELVEGVNLLGHQRFVCEVGSDHGPAVLLRDQTIVVEVLVLLLLALSPLLTAVVIVVTQRHRFPLVRSLCRVPRRLILATDC